MAFGAVVVGVDLSPGSVRALEWAVGEASRRGSGLRLVHVIDDADRDVAQNQLGGLPELVGRMVLAMHEAMARRLDSAVVIEARVAAPASADAVLAEESATVDLLVIGANGTAGYAGSALGSVAERVAVHARCPVVVVATRGQAERPRRIVAPSSGAAAAYAGEVAAATGASLAAVELSGADAPQRLVAAARAADLVVLPVKRSAESFSSRVGPLVATVLPTATCPVLLVGED